VDPSLFVAPPPHIKLGLVNRAFIKPDGYSYLSWSKQRIESIPAIEKIAFTLFLVAVDKFIEAEEDQLLWSIRYQEDFLAVKEHLQRVRASLKRRNLSNDEKAELKENEAIVQHEYVDLNQTRDNIVKKVKEARIEKSTFDKAYKMEKKKRNYQSNLIQNRKENLLKELGKTSSPQGSEKGRGGGGGAPGAHEEREKTGMYAELWPRRMFPL